MYIMKTRFLTISILLLMGLGAGQLAEAKTAMAKKWVLLGTKKVDYALDRDVMHLGAHEGVYVAIKLKVVDGGLNMHKMVVEYGNGTRDEIEVRHNFSRGSETRIIDLQGGVRIIRSITFWYDTKNYSGRKAKILVYGRHP